MQDMCSVPLSAHKSVAFETAKAVFTQLSSVEDWDSKSTEPGDPFSICRLGPDRGCSWVEPPPTARCEEVGNAL